MEQKLYVDLKAPINTLGGNTLNKLKLSIDYQKGGFSYFTGEYSNSGIYVYITPCSYENGIVGTTITGKQHTDGYKILLKELNRKSQKQIDLMAEKVIPYAQQIADLYSNKQHKDVYDLVMSVIK